ncbi:MAG: hypothetical protein IPM46_08750 [Flavobacteriales bacterium]|nr:hypothetical protein [Flavobacteriales bacterium]
MRAPLLVSSVLCCSVVMAQTDKPRKPLRYDAAVVAIIVPSDEPRYAEHNPAVHAPRVVIRNEGTDPLVGISIRYGTEGFPARMYAWTGHLASGASAEVKLTHLIDMHPGLNTFTVKLGDPNGKKDRDPQDNARSGVFTAADTHGGPITLRLRTPANNGGSLRLENTRGPVPVEWNWPSGADTVRRETVELTPGSYFLHVVDSGRAEPASVQVFDAGGALVKAMRSKPKDGATYQFRIEANTPGRSGPSGYLTLMRSAGRGRAVLDALLERPAMLVVTDLLGNEVMRRSLAAGVEITERIDLSEQRAGAYNVQVEEEGGVELLREVLRVDERDPR